MSSKYVLKVQYEDTLRRLNLGAVDIDIAKLETRICGLFQIDPTSQLHLTYTDKDGDVVTLVDDNDLTDALVVQSINPLRLRIASVRNRAPSPKLQQRGPLTSTGDGNDRVRDGRDEEIDPTSFAPSGIAPTSLGNQHRPDDPATGRQEQPHFGNHCAMCDMPADGQWYRSKVSDYDLCRSCFLRTGSSPDGFYEIDQSTSDPALQYPVVRGKSIMAGGSYTPPLGEAHKDIPTELDDSADNNQFGNVAPTREPACRGKSIIMQDGRPAPPWCGEGENPKDIPTQLDDYGENSQPENITLTRFPVWQGKSIIMHGDKPAPPWCGTMRSPKDIPTQMDNPANILPGNAPDNLLCQGGKAMQRHGPIGEPPTPAVDVKAPPVESKPEVGKGRVQHHGVVCDGCGLNPLVGPRMISKTRRNYDLCVDCFEKSGENPRNFSRADEPGLNNTIVAAMTRLAPSLIRRQYPSENRSVVEVQRNREAFQNNVPAPANNSTRDLKDEATKNDITSMDAEAPIAPPLNEATPAEDDLNTKQRLLLIKLTAMGFFDEELNVTLLEKNNSDLTRTIEDLCTTEN